MRPLRFHPEAREELRAAALFYEEQSTQLGRELVREVRTTLLRVQEFPESGSPDEEGARRVVLPRFPFAVIYRADEDAIYVMAIMHQRQKPGYWRDR